MKPIPCLAKLLTGCVMGDGEESRTKGTKGEKGPSNSMAMRQRLLLAGKDGLRANQSPFSRRR
jgi:hypothetical protein